MTNDTSEQWEGQVLLGRKHLLPIDDLKPHVQSGMSCWCKPREEDEWIIHHSMDGREDYESGRRKVH